MAEIGNEFANRMSKTVQDLVRGVSRGLRKRHCRFSFRDPKMQRAAGVRRAGKKDYLSVLQQYRANL